MSDSNIDGVETTNFSPFYTPFREMEILVKADKDDPYTIYLEASNEDADSQRDILFMKALEEEAESFLKSGLISWDHLHKLKNDPEYIVGEPLDVKFDLKGRRTFVKSKLYRDVDYSKKIVNLLKSGCTRLGASVGGFIKKKKSLSKSLSGILKVIWDELAITYKPVNQSTMGNVSLIPVGAFIKALAVGSGVNAAQFTGGRALTGESLQGNMVTRNNIQPVINELVWRLKGGDIVTADDLKDFLSYHDVLFLYGKLAKVITQKF